MYIIKEKNKKKKRKLQRLYVNVYHESFDTNYNFISSILNPWSFPPWTNFIFHQYLQAYHEHGSKNIPLTG